MSALNDSLDQLMSALAAALPARLVGRKWVDTNQRNRAELEQGVYTLISRRESGFADYPGRQAELGTLEMALIGQVLVAERDGGDAVEAAELAMVDEIKTFMNSLPLAMNLKLVDWHQSGQIEAPYGWVAFKLVWYLN